MKNLYLIDSMALAFRAFYAFPTTPLSNSRGEETTVVFGYGNYLFRLLSEKSVDHIAIATDLPGPNFRHQLYDQYKANRSAMPENMKQQLPMLQEFLEILNIPILSQSGFEADDLIGSAAKQYLDSQIYICSKDKDLMQLINERVFLLYQDKREEVIVGTEQVIEKWGVRPDQVRDLLALMGDSSDNVPGVPKVGVKTAAQLLQEFGNLEEIYGDLEKVSKKGLRENLLNHRDSALLSQKLVSLDCELPLPPLESLTFNGFDWERMEQFLNRYELRSLLRVARKAASMASTAPSAAPVAKIQYSEPKYHLVSNPEEFQALLNHLESSPLIALDTETTSLNVRQAQVVGICLAADGENGYYLPLAHENGSNLDLPMVKLELEKLFARDDKFFVCHHAKYDLAVLRNNDWTLPLNIHDTLIASYLLNPGVREHSLDDQVLKRLDHTMIPIENLIGKGKSQILFSQVSVQDAADYGAEDALFTWRLWQILGPELQRENLWEIYLNQEIPVMKTLLQIEDRGITLDPQALQILNDEICARLVQVEELVYQSAGMPFAINSPKQLGEILFDHLKLAHGKKTKTGWSTDASVLESLRGSHPIADLILEYRELEKLRNTYVEVLPQLMDPQTHRIHTSYSQTITATGRLSSQNPNLQNIPIRTPLGARIRSAFVRPNEDWCLMSADYSQIELRVLAHLSGDENLIRAYRDGIDIHSQTAAAIYSTFPEMVSSEMRRAAKAVNFGVLYGMSAFRLSNELGIARRTAQDFIDGYFATYPKVTAFIRETIEQSRQSGFAKTLSGLRRQLPEINHENANIRSAAERTAVNTPVQGTAADLIKKAMINLEREIPLSGLRLRLLLQVHDELVFEVHHDDLIPAQALVKKGMEEVAELAVPLVVEIGVASNWKDAH